MSVGDYIVDGHLGGYFAGGDPATMYPDLWRWLVQIKGVRSVLDVGCGDGSAMNVFFDLGAEVIGVDGIPQPDPRIFTHDFTEGPWHPLYDEMEGLAIDGWDLVWSCEFVEHVEQRFLPNVLDALTRAPVLLMTHATPGQGGHHHVNCQESAYWIGALATCGFELDEALTRDTRAIAGANLNPYNHYVRSGLAFRARPGWRQ